MKSESTLREVQKSGCGVPPQSVREASRLPSSAPRLTIFRLNRNPSTERPISFLPLHFSISVFSISAFTPCPPSTSKSSPRTAPPNPTPSPSTTPSYSREMQVIAGLKHPNIVRFLDSGHKEPRHSCRAASVGLNRFILTLKQMVRPHRVPLFPTPQVLKHARPPQTIL